MIDFDEYMANAEEQLRERGKKGKFTTASNKMGAAIYGDKAKLDEFSDEEDAAFFDDEE